MRENSSDVTERRQDNIGTDESAEGCRGADVNASHDSGEDPTEDDCAKWIMLTVIDM